MYLGNRVSASEGCEAAVAARLHLGGLPLWNVLSYYVE